MERTYKLVVWFKGVAEVAWTEIIKTSKTERDFEKFIEAEKVNTNLFDYSLVEM